MSDKVENPPAFPSGETASGNPTTWGMTLRDYFAAKAMQSILLTNWYNEADKDLTRPYSETARHIAEDSYRLADAMLQERIKQ